MRNQRWHVALPVAGFLVCITWYSLVTAYKNLNTAKFRIIHEVERNLPVALFRSEWQLCEYGVGKKYRPLPTSRGCWFALYSSIGYTVLGTACATKGLRRSTSSNRNPLHDIPGSLPVPSAWLPALHIDPSPCPCCLSRPGAAPVVANYPGCLSSALAPSLWRMKRLRKILCAKPFVEFLQLTSVENAIVRR